MRNKFIEWRHDVDNFVALSLFETQERISLPVQYKNLVRFHDGGILGKDLFYYVDDNKNYRDCVGRFLYWQATSSSHYYSHVANVYNNPPEFFPKGFIPFAPDGGGNYLCFDYRSCKENPPIVFWHHEIEKDAGIIPLARSFEDFLNNLQSE